MTNTEPLKIVQVVPSANGRVSRDSFDAALLASGVAPKYVLTVAEQLALKAIQDEDPTVLDYVDDLVIAAANERLAKLNLIYRNERDNEWVAR